MITPSMGYLSVARGGKFEHDPTNLGRTGAERLRWHCQKQLCAGILPKPHRY